MEPGLLKFLRLLLWMQGRTFLARVRDIRRQSRLLLSVLGCFIVGYLVFGYLLFYEGLEFVVRFPVVGALLSQRILFLIFAFFFLMLVFSNTITGYATFFKNRETAWFLTLPVRHRHVFFWKFLEALFVSSWALLFLSAPLMAAYGRVHEVGPGFYAQVLLVFIPFVVLPAVLGAWIILAIVRFMSRGWLKKALLPIVGVLILVLVFGMRPTSGTTVTAAEDTLSFEQLLRHSRITVNAAMPSAWMARSILALSRDLFAQGAFYFLLLLSHAVLGLILTYELGGRFFYAGWSMSSAKRTESFHRKARAARSAHAGIPPVERFLAWLPCIDRPSKALLLKDFRIFWREPAQWTQFAVFFGLLCIYVLNLRNVAYDFESEFWGTVISHLNLGASALTLSTLTTRFVFPQFSLEGRRLWIIGLAPIGLGRVLMQKFWTSCAGSILITVSLMIISAVMLKLSIYKVAYFACAIAVMSAALSGLAVGLGALFPNLKEDNPSKIVSGFGGTLCLVVSFVYIILFIGVLAVPASFPFTLPGLEPATARAATAGATLVAALLSAVVVLVPMRLALRKVKTLEF